MYRVTIEQEAKDNLRTHYQNRVFRELRGWALGPGGSLRPLPNGDSDVEVTPSL